MECRLEAGRRGDAAVAVALAAFLVADAVERGQYLAAELARFRQHGLDQIGRGVGEAGEVVVALEMEDVVQQERHVVDRRLVARHNCPSETASKAVSGRGQPESPIWLTPTLRQGLGDCRHFGVKAANCSRPSGGGFSQFVVERRIDLAQFGNRHLDSALLPLEQGDLLDAFLAREM